MVIDGPMDYVTLAGARALARQETEDELAELA